MTSCSQKCEMSNNRSIIKVIKKYVWLFMTNIITLRCLKSLSIWTNSVKKYLYLIIVWCTELLHCRNPSFTTAQCHMEHDSGWVTALHWRLFKQMLLLKLHYVTFLLKIDQIDIMSKYIKNPSSKTWFCLILNHYTYNKCLYLDCFGREAHYLHDLS